ncbi:hypothetical protein GCWU000322_00076 [Eubacterium saphenum ATCC 49989]|nr:hypothetical protein GCWU000322_00076 [Eubacterium saphenum ATCC 49989]
MLTPEYLDSAPSETLGVIDEFEKYVIAEVAKRLVLLGYDEHSETFRRKLKAEGDKLFKQALTQVGIVSNHSDVVLRKTFEEAINTNVRSENDRFKSWGMAAVGVTPKMVRIATEHYAFAKAEVRKYCARAVYSSSKLLIDVAGNIHRDVRTGKETYHKIIKRYIEKLSRRGLTVTHPASGRVDKLDVAVRRSVLTAINQASGRVNLEYCDEAGLDLVEVTSHIGARPTHAAWQGGVYSRSGSSVKYPDFETSTGYGTGAGLCGWNCRHNFYGYIEGMPRARSDDELASIDDGTLTWGADTFTPYEASQKQRELERGIRASKRELVGLESAGRSAPAAERHVYTKAYEAKAVKLARQRSELNSFCRATGRRIDRTRTSVIAHKDKHGRIYAFGRKEAGKARSVALKAYYKATYPEFQRYYKLCKPLCTEEEWALFNDHLLNGEHKGYFQSPNAFRLNEWLRRGLYDQLPPYDQKTVRALQSAIGRTALPKPYMLYRFDGVEALQSMLGMKVDELLTPGKATGRIVSTKQFLSTSMLKDINKFKDRPVLWRIRAPKGLKGLTNGYPDESEILLAVGQRFKILKIYKERGKIIVQAEALLKGG